MNHWLKAYSIWLNIVACALKAFLVAQALCSHADGQVVESLSQKVERKQQGRLATKVTTRDFGTAFCIGKEDKIGYGYLFVTCAHNIQQGTFYVAMHGRFHKCRVLAVDRDADLALVSLKTNLKVHRLELADSMPAGTFRACLTGWSSGHLHRKMTSVRRVTDEGLWPYKADVSVPRGMSGSPATLQDGKTVVGIVHAASGTEEEYSRLTGADEIVAFVNKAGLRKKSSHIHPVSSRTFCPPVRRPLSQPRIDYNKIANLVVSRIANDERFRGQPGRDGQDGRDGMDGQDGLNGQDGSDGSDAEITEETYAQLIAHLDQHWQAVNESRFERFEARLRLLEDAIASAPPPTDPPSGDKMHVVVVADEESDYWVRLETEIESARNHFSGIRVAPPPEDFSVQHPQLILYRGGDWDQQIVGNREVVDALRMIARDQFPFTASE